MPATPRTPETKATAPERRGFAGVGHVGAGWSVAVFSRETLAGIVTSLALVPEVISFSYVAGVDPRVSLFASVVLALTMSALGGRTAMVTAAAGSVALVIGPLVKAHGVEYVLPTVLLAGAGQIVFGLCGFARAMRFVPRSVMIGFVNALGILIFLAQVPHVLGRGPTVLILFAATVAIVLVTPRLTKAVPAPLVAIVVVTAIAAALTLPVPSVGGGGMGGGVRHDLFHLTALRVPLTVETFRLILPTALSIAFVGLLESLLTAKLVDEMTDTRSDKGRESWALGVANVLATLFGGIGGCAMIGQTMVNVKMGRARTRLSTTVAGLTLLLLVTTLDGLLAKIPLVSLAAVMMVVAITTIDWRSVAPSTLRRMPWPETIVMAATVGVTTATGNLAYGIACGVMLAMAFFARRVSHVVDASRRLAVDGLSVRYDVRGALFFASSTELVERFDFVADPGSVTIDLTQAQVWDASSVATLDAVEAKYGALGKAVRLVGLDERSTSFHGRLTGHLR